MQGFWDWLSDNEWSAWLGLAFLFGIFETTTLDLVFLMMAAGALSGALAAILEVPLVGQMLIAIGVSAIMIGVVRPIAKRHMRMPQKVRTGVAALVGQSAVVLEPVDGDDGRIKLAGEEWTARSFDGRTEIEAGKNVDVIEIDGATALVLPEDGPL
ncbi:NfeD family protein [Actinobacteria bacterium YIM 96077]|uniref:NfeD family protein n=1 Tax=Phytoactinopolyspora halophila TaxID=1981511 RepID=A0A329QLI9_9ACTN|nr:NfeD family protein [Phytoactinopolyspora halophila]AYY12981.1 NfeD family protein [Actinobacteria bacterium YIM 96077]RAW13245.1 NfeD family protein [Phytoactinopolyspora halophila]